MNFRTTKVRELQLQNFVALKKHVYGCKSLFTTANAHFAMTTLLFQLQKREEFVLASSICPSRFCSFWIGELKLSHLILQLLDLQTQIVPPDFGAANSNCPPPPPPRSKNCSGKLKLSLPRSNFALGRQTHTVPPDFAAF